MNVTLADGTELTVLMVTGENNYVQGVERDTLAFVFDDTVSLDEMDSIFTEGACETITLRDGSDEYIYSTYTIRAGLEKTMEKTDEVDDDGAPIYVGRIKVKMSQRTYTETQLKSLIETVDTLVLEDLLEG